MRFKNKIQKIPVKIILMTVFFSVTASSENLRPIPSYIDVGYKYVGYNGSIYGVDLMRPFLYNTVVKYQSQIGLEERIKSMRGWYYDPRTGQLQKNTPPYGEKSKNCWPGVFFERRHGIRSFDGKNINVPEVCIKGTIPQKNPVYKYNSKEAEIFFKAYKRLQDGQNFVKSIGAFQTLFHLDNRNNLLGEHRSYTAFSNFPTATKVIAEFAKLFGRKYLAVMSPPAYEYNIGAKRYTKVGLYDFCKICASSQARKNFIDNSDPIWKKFERHQVAMFMCRVVSEEASAYQSSRGWHPCKVEPNKALRNHETYKFLVRKAQKVLENSPQLFQHDMFQNLREEVKRVAENSPQPAKVLTQNIFDFSGWPFSGKPGGFCSKDSDCIVLTKNCCGCGGAKAYKGSDKTLFAIDKDSLVDAEAYPSKWTLRQYQYDRRTYCRANFGVEPYIKDFAPGVGSYQRQFEILGVKTCPRSIPRKESICGGYKGKCSKNNKCIVVTAGGEPVGSSPDKDKGGKDDGKDSTTQKENDPTTDQQPTTGILAAIQSELTQGCKRNSDCAVVSGGCCSCAMGGAPLAILHLKTKKYVSHRLSQCKKAGKLYNKGCKAGNTCQSVKAACVNSKCVTQPQTKTPGSSSGSR